MLKCFYILLIWIAVFKLCFCQRRMGLGNESVLGKKYLVYFVKSPYSESDDDAWLCAGAIVSPTQILTAAACLVEMDRIYAISGNKKYVHNKDIDKDKCASMWKKKVIKISVPKEYATSTAKQIEWMNVDIGVATVQEPYDFNDQTYLTHCSYVPESIKINYDENNEKENTRAIALGWGGTKIKSKELTEKEKLKPKLLQEVTTTIIEKSFCTKLKNGSTELVNKYLLCASGNGFLGEDEDETTSNSTVEELLSLAQNNGTKNIDESDEMNSRKSTLLETCQNDHGGPLVTWVGTEEVVLGVALNGICNPNFDCVGPRIYVSTTATAKIIECLLETDNIRRETCNGQIDDKRYQVNDIEIKWPEDLNKNSSLRTQQNPLKKLSRRQRNEEETLHVRPTKDLRSFDEPEIPQEYPPYNPLNNLQENQQDNPQGNQQDQPEERPIMNRQRIPQENREQNPYNEQSQSSQADQTQGSVNEEPNNQSRKPLAGYISQQQMESQNQPEIYGYNQPQKESQNQPQIDGFNQAQIDSYNQPPLDPYYNQPPVDANYNQPPMDSYYNQPKIKSEYPRETDSYNQPQAGSYNQPQMGLSNQPHMASENQPQRQINPQSQSINNNPEISTLKPPQMESYMASEEEPYNQPQIGSYKKPFKDIFKLPTFKKTPIESFEEPQAEKFNKVELGSLKQLPSKVEPLRQTQYSNKEPESPYSHKQKESFKPVTAESYNPLDIIMAENEPEDDSLIPLMEEPYKPPPVEVHKQPNANPYMPQPVKPGLNKPLQQPLSSKRNQPDSVHHEQPLGQPFVGAPAPPFDSSHTPMALREAPPRNPALVAPYDEPQTFEKMYSQLHAGPEAPDPPSPSKEETFDELFRDLHDRRVEQPRDKKLEPQAYEKQHGGVQVRQQAPLEYTDYASKSRNS